MAFGGQTGTLVEHGKIGNASSVSYFRYRELKEKFNL